MAEVIIQDSLPICPRCKCAMRKIYSDDIWYVCVNSYCKSILKLIDRGQSEREVRCEVIQ